MVLVEIFEYTGRIFQTELRTTKALPFLGLLFFRNKSLYGSITQVL